MTKTVVLIGVIVLSFAACDKGQKVLDKRDAPPAATPF